MVFEVGGHEENGNFILNQQQMTYNARPLPQKNPGGQKRRRRVWGKLEGVDGTAEAKGFANVSDRVTAVFSARVL